MNDAKPSFDQLYDRHFKEIFRYVLRRVANVAQAEDLTAQTFYKALRGFWRYRLTASSPSAWFYRIATNEINSHYRRQHPAPPLDATRSSELLDAERELAVHRLYLDLHRALRQLPDGDQALIVLRYFEQKSYDEIVEILGGRKGTMAMRANRALKKLKNELNQRGIDHEELRGILAATERARPEGQYLPADAAS